MIGKNLQKALGLAVEELKQRRHEYLTLEHVLYGIASEPAGRKLIERCGGSAAVLRQALDHFFKTYMESLPEPTKDVYQTLAVQRVLDNALAHVKSAGRDDEIGVEVGDVIAAILEEEDSWAAYCLKKQGITRLAVLENLSTGEDGASSEEGGTESGAEGGAESVKDALARYTVDLTARAREGKLDPLVGRETELARSIEILARRRKNNPLYVGDPGTGKTAIAEGLALRIAGGDVPPEFKDTKIYSLDLGAVLAGARYRGDFEGRIKAVVAALQKIPGAILFIDEIHTIVGAGSTSGGSMDASNLLKPILAEGKLRCIGSTTYDEFRNHFEKDRALARRFQKVDIKEPSLDECVDILKGLQPHYEKHHNVRYSASSLKAAVELSARHVQDRLLPDKAIDVMDEVGASVRLRPGFKPGSSVSRQDVERIVARMAGIPARTVSGKERDRLKTLKGDLLSVLFGQDEAVDIVTRAILRSRAGLGRTDRPAGSFLFYGPTGVGKTELAKQLAERLGVSFLRFDMSEYMEKHAVSRLIGAPPGYVGFDQGGLLTEAVRKTPYAVVLMDEIEKAHPDIFNVLLQVMDYGTLTDNTGRKADFKNVILILTSNAGVRDMEATPMGFLEAAAGKEAQSAAQRGRKAVEAVFSPEFRNRLDALVPFNALTPDMMGMIVDKGIAEMGKGLAEKRVNLTLTPAARSWLAKEGYDAKLGARPLQRLLREALEDPLAGEVLFGRLTKGGTVVVDEPEEGGDKLTLKFEEK
uniref:ATP-dependent Clp protease ATP-binding subunit ClpA n=1 Tax=uncultured Bilophila sp. TaxID=529385 RepID=UPI0025FE7B4A|nr:ATP-dependent Clp protease ATP-binding subunit ClpA [uncultured Bilophila sp.]